MSTLDTPQSSFTSLYDDANAARLTVNFESVAFLALWATLLAVDAMDRLMAAVVSFTDSVAAMSSFVAALLQLLIAAAALSLATAALIVSTRVGYYVIRSQPTMVLIAAYVVAAHATSAATKSVHPVDSRVLGNMATVVMRLELLLAPFFFVGRLSRLSSRRRALICMCSPLLAGCAVLAIALTALLRGQDEWLLDVPSAGGRLPLLTFLTAVIVAFWAASGLLAGCSNDDQTMRIHVATSIPTLLLSIASFSICSPALATAGGSNDLNTGFAGVGPTALAVLMCTSIALPAYLLAQHVEFRRSRKVDSIDRLFPRKPPVAYKELEDEVVIDTPPTPPSMPYFPPLYDPWGRWNPQYDDEYASL